MINIIGINKIIRFFSIVLLFQTTVLHGHAISHKAGLNKHNCESLVGTTDPLCGLIDLINDLKKTNPDFKKFMDVGPGANGIAAKVVNIVKKFAPNPDQFLNDIPKLTKLAEDFIKNPQLVDILNNPNIVKAWELISYCSSAVRSRVDILDDLSLAVQRGALNIQDLLTYANVTVPWINENSIVHIFRGEGYGKGLHHISGILGNNGYSLSAIRGRTAEGFYKADILPNPNNQLLKYEKGFWPDSWDEKKIIDKIKEAESRIPDIKEFSVDNFGNMKWESTLVSGQKIAIVKTPSGILKTAYPIL